MQNPDICKVYVLHKLKTFSVIEKVNDTGLPVPEIGHDGHVERRVDVDGSVAVRDIARGGGGEAADEERVSGLPDPVQTARSAAFVDSEGLCVKEEVEDLLHSLLIFHFQSIIILKVSRVSFISREVELLWNCFGLDGRVVSGREF